mgnify:CR=1 FL=1
MLPRGRIIVDTNRVLSYYRLSPDGTRYVLAETRLEVAERNLLAAIYPDEPAPVADIEGALAIGVFRAMMEDHLPLDIVIEPDVENPETLRPYKVLILPNAACLSTGSPWSCAQRVER